MASKRVEGILRSVYERVQQLMEADRFYAALHNPVKAVLEFPVVAEDGSLVTTGQGPWQPRPFRKDAWLPDLAVARQAPLLLAEDLKTALREMRLEYWPGDEPSLSWLGAPMIVEGRGIGALVVENRCKPSAFGEREAGLLSTIARQAAMAIENIRLSEQRDRQIANLEAVYEVGQRLTSGIRLSKPEILKLIYEQASQLMDTNNLYIALYEPDSKHPDKYDSNVPQKSQIHGTVRFGLMLVDGKPMEVASRPAGYGRTEWIIRTRQPILILTRAESEAWYREPGRQEYIGEPFASWVGVPMIVGDSVLGVIATYHKTQDYVYDEEDMRVLSLMASQAAVALENARLYESLEERVRERTQQLVEAQKRIADTEAVLVRANIATDFVHRINNLAGATPVWVDLIIERLVPSDPRDEQIKDYLQKIKKDFDGLLRAAEELDKPLRKEDVDLVFLLEAMLRNVATLYSTTITIDDTELEHDLYRVWAVPAELGNAIWNVISNALEAMPDGGRLIVRARNQVDERQEKWVHIEIEDTGSGIPPDKLPLMFELFHTTKGEGRGYGLWRAKNVIEGIGGAISVKSETNVGSTFFIEMPAILPAGE